jgi:hypothetical protein
MKQETLAAPSEGNFNHIYELGKLSGEVKVLKWGAAISITMIFAYLTFLSQQVSGLQTSLEQQVGEVREEVSAVKEGQSIIREREGQSIIRERLGVIEQRVTGMDQRITTNEMKVNTHSHL